MGKFNKIYKKILMEANGFNNIENPLVLELIDIFKRYLPTIVIVFVHPNFYEDLANGFINDGYYDRFNSENYEGNLALFVEQEIKNAIKQVSGYNSRNECPNLFLRNIYIYMKGNGKVAINLNSDRV